MNFKLTCLSLAASALAHFTLDQPAAWGVFDEDTQPEFCGGLPEPTNRTLFPLTNGIVAIDSHHDSGFVGLLISFKSNPTQFTDFQNNGSSPLLFNYTTLGAGQGEYCLNVSAQTAFPAQVQEGTNATIQVQYQGGDGFLYACSDVTFSASAPASNITCGSAFQLTSSTVTAADTAEASASVSTGTNQAADTSSGDHASASATGTGSTPVPQTTQSSHAHSIQPSMGVASAIALAGVAMGGWLLV